MTKITSYPRYYNFIVSGLFIHLKITWCLIRILNCSIYVYLYKFILDYLSRLLMNCLQVAPADIFNTLTLELGISLHILL